MERYAQQMTNTNRDAIFKVFAGFFLLAALYHVVGFFLPGLVIPSAHWRHGVFVVINLGGVWLFLRRPYWLIFPFSAVTAQQLYSHSRRLWLWWNFDNRIDWISIFVVIILLTALLLIVEEMVIKRNNQQPNKALHPTAQTTRGGVSRLTMDEHKIFIIGGNDDEFGILRMEERDYDCCLEFIYRNKSLKACEADFFEAFSAIRLELEKERLIPFCYGASLNVYPSGMSRNMGGGVKAYKLSTGQQAKMKDLVYIFSEGPDVIPTYVLPQREFYEEWLKSL